MHKGHRLTGLRHIVPRGDPLRGKHLTGCLIFMKIAISIPGQQSCFTSHLNTLRFLFLSGVINGNSCRRTAYYEFLLYKKKTAGHWALLPVHRSEQEDIQRNQYECVEKDQPPFQANALIYNEWQQGSSPGVKEVSRSYSSNVVVMTYLLWIHDLLLMTNPKKVFIQLLTQWCRSNSVKFILMLKLNKLQRISWPVIKCNRISHDNHG